MPAPEAFKQWANEYREAALVRQRSQGRGGSGGTARWWRTIEDDLRCFLLSRQAPDDWQRWMACEWNALPAALRDVLSIDVAALRRSLGGCAWRA